MNEALTCGQLDRLSNQVARSLIANGVTRGDRVGIDLYKSPASIAAIFGIMKTGACYVPVDANAPGPRLEEIGRQCAFRALISSHELYQKLSGSFHHECPMNAIYFIDKAPEAALPLPALTFADNLPQQSSEDPAVPVIDNDLAYILFTSGSTGVRISRADICQLGVRNFRHHGERQTFQSRSVQTSISRSLISLSRSRRVRDFTRARRAGGFSAAIVIFHSGPKDHGLVFRPDGAGAPAGARETRRARSRRPSTIGCWR